jgi:hypothetical protein
MTSILAVVIVEGCHTRQLFFLNPVQTLKAFDEF